MDGTVNEARRDDGRPARCATGAEDVAGGTGSMAGAAMATGLDLGAATGAGFTKALVFVAINGSGVLGFARADGAGFAAGVFAFAVAARVALAAWTGFVLFLAGFAVPAPRTALLAGAFLASGFFGAGLAVFFAVGFFTATLAAAALVALGATRAAGLTVFFAFAGLAFTDLTPRSK